MELKLEVNTSAECCVVALRRADRVFAGTFKDGKLIQSETTIFVPGESENESVSEAKAAAAAKAAAEAKAAAAAKAAVETNDVADAKAAAVVKVDDSSNDASFCSLRAQHESILRRLSPSPLPADATHAGNIHNGYGIKLFKDGAIYAGDFADGLRSGHGVQRWSDGDFYAGEWREDARDGYGSYRFSHGDEDLSGAIEDSECDRYDGEWKDNHFQGKGWCRSAA